jgi:diguanylate cyclase (GGDEF)-like protein
VHDAAQPREQIARILEQRVDVVVNDALGVFPFAGIETLDTLGGTELAALLAQLLASATRNGELDSREGRIADLHRLTRTNALTVGQLFSLTYLVERAALDELAVDESFGATSEPWPAVAQMVRRASFDVMAAYTERGIREPGPRALIDPLTTLHTRGVLIAAIEKEIHRSERTAHPFALIVFDVDRLSEINDTHGYGFGDRVLERVGILITNYFRDQDWVSRCSEDAFAVLLPETQGANAEMLAERLRATVQDRLALRDHVTEQQVDVTVSVAILAADSVDATITAEQLMQDAEAAVRRAKEGGRNRVERLRVSVREKSQIPSPKSQTPTEAADVSRRRSGGSF